MFGTRNTNAGPVAGVLLILALLFVAAACGAVGATTASQAPASPAPSEQPTAPAPTAAPSEAPADGAIDLDVADASDVSVVVSDPDGVLAGAASGRAGDGMSVRWGDVEIANLDDDSLRVTWVGMPADAEIRLEVQPTGDGIVLAFTQPAPPANSDAIGFDRVLVLDFAEPVRSEDVRATFSTAS
jgi:hypothetical protein